MTRVPRVPEAYREQLLGAYLPASATKGVAQYLPPYLEYGRAWTAPSVAAYGWEPIVAVIASICLLALWTIASELDAKGWA